MTVPGGCRSQGRHRYGWIFAVGFGNSRHVPMRGDLRQSSVSNSISNSIIRTEIRPTEQKLRSQYGT